MTNEYQRKKHEEAMAAQASKIEKEIAMFGMRHCNPEQVKDSISFMNMVEKCLVTCGSEPKPHFLEVSNNFLQIYTLVKMNANIYPFYSDEHPKNDRFHKVVTQTLLGMGWVDSVRWLPKENGSILLVTRRVQDDSSSC